MLGPLLKVQMSFCVAGARDSAPCQKWAGRKGFVWFCSISKNDGMRGTFAEDPQRCISRGRCSTRDMFIRDVGRSGPGADVLRGVAFWSIRGVDFAWQAQHFVWPGINFRGRRNTLETYGKIAKRIGTSPSALHSTCHFWRKSRRIASFLLLSTRKLRTSRRIASFLALSSSKIEEVSLNCRVFDVAKFKNWGSLAE